MSTITMSEVDTLRAYRDRAESSYDESCRALVEDIDNAAALTILRSNALRLRQARSQYAISLRELGSTVLGGV